MKFAMPVPTDGATWAFKIIDKPLEEMTQEELMIAADLYLSVVYHSSGEELTSWALDMVEEIEQYL